jgi:hypothetical protein
MNDEPGMPTRLELLGLALVLVLVALMTVYGFSLPRGFW